MYIRKTIKRIGKMMNNTAHDDAFTFTPVKIKGVSVVVWRTGVEHGRSTGGAGWDGEQSGPKPTVNTMDSMGGQ